MVKLNRRVLGYCLAFICSAGVGALLQRIVASPQLRGGVPADGLVTTSLGGRMLLALDSVLPSPDGAVILNGRIDTQSMPLAGLPSEGWVSAVAVLMTASEWRSCEDLGRQLRELRREAAARGLQMVIWTDEKSFEAVQRELYRERISEVTLAAVDDLGSRCVYPNG